MTDDLTVDPGTFDLIGAIEGTTRPTKEVKFLFDQEAARAVANIEAELKKLTMLGKSDEYDELEKVKVDLIENLKDSLFTVTVQSIPRKVKKAIMQKVDAKYPEKRNALGILEATNYEAIEYLHVLEWQAHIVGFEAPDGKRVTVPLSEESIAKLLDEAPEASLSAIADAINELENGAKAGYDQIVQGIGFLSER